MRPSLDETQRNPENLIEHLEARKCRSQLSDILETEIGAREMPIPGVPGLWGLEISTADPVGHASALPAAAARRIRRTDENHPTAPISSRLKQTPFLDLIASWSDLSQEIAAFFKDSNNTAFVLVTIAEGLGVYQTRRLVGEFSRFGLDVRHLIVNQVVNDPDSDFMRARQAMQAPYLRLLQEEYGGRMKIIQLPQFPHEIKGVDRLNQEGGAVFLRHAESKAGVILGNRPTRLRRGRPVSAVPTDVAPRR